MTEVSGISSILSPAAKLERIENLKLSILVLGIDDNYIYIYMYTLEGTLPELAVSAGQPQVFAQFSCAQNDSQAFFKLRPPCLTCQSVTLRH